MTRPGWNAVMKSPPATCTPEPTTAPALSVYSSDAPNSPVICRFGVDTPGAAGCASP